jgi:hypothetical protein
MVLVLTISAKGEVELAEVDEDEEPELPRLPAAVPVGLLVEELDDDPLFDVVDVEALEFDPADTLSPGERLATDTIVPLIGAYSLVAASAVWALLTLASALYTAACAEAIDPAGEFELLVPVEPLPVDPPLVEPDPAEPPPPDGAVADVLGAVVVVGAVVVDLVVVVVVWVVVGFVVVVVGTVLVSDTNSVVPEPELVSRLAVVAVELVVDVALASAVLSWSSAEVRFCSDWSSESCAEVESSVASSWPFVTC